MRGELNRASFDLTDPLLNKKMGALHWLPIQFRCSFPFPDSSQSPKCTNLSCFKIKTDSHFDKEFAKALLDPEVILVHDSHGDNSDKTVVKATGAGHAVISGSGYIEVEKPVHPDLEEWYDDNEYDFDNEAEARKDYQLKAIPAFKKELAEYEKKIAGGKLKKAFMLTGDDRGKYIYIDLRKNGTSSSSSTGSSTMTKAKETAGTLTAADIDEEIKRLQDREKRNKELDLQKTHVELLAALEDRKEFESKTFPLQPADRGIMAFLLLTSAGLENDTIKGLPDYDGERHSYNEAYFNKLCKVTDEQLALIIRIVAMHKYGSRNMQYGVSAEDTIMRIIARYLDVDIDGIDRKQNEIAMVRHEKLTARIAQLKAQKKQLEKPAAKVSATKTPKPAKSAKKAAAK
jgi:hypothetical protein